MDLNDIHYDMSHDERLVYCIRQGENKEACQILREMDYWDTTDSISGETLLHVAADSDNVTIAHHLIDRGCEVDAVDNNRNTPLIVACQLDNMAVIKVLVEAKASVLTSNRERKSAAKIFLGSVKLDIFILIPFLKRVKEECSNDSLRTAKELLRVGCPLTRAMSLKDVAITKYMLEHCCDINYQDDPLDGMTPLHQALVLKDDENAKLLIDRGADLNFKDAFGVTPLGHAYDIEILETLLNKGAKIVDNNRILIPSVLFCSRGKEVVEILISRYNLTDLSIRDLDGTTLFHLLVSSLSFDPVEILKKHLKHSLDINQKDGMGVTALLMAVTAGNVGTVEFLLKRGAEFIGKDVWDDEVYNAIVGKFSEVTQEKRAKILMLLLQYGADIQWTGNNARGIEYSTLDYVVRRKHFAMLKVILARLALVEDLGVEIKKVYRNEIEFHAMCKKYFGFCKRKIEKLKKTVIKRRVTLFDFMTCSEEKLVKFARSEEFVATVQSMVYRKRHSNLYYYKVLRLRVKKAVEMVNLREDLFCDVNCQIPELHSNQIIIEKIVEYIVCDMLRLMARQPTFKCIIDNE